MMWTHSLRQSLRSLLRLLLRDLWAWLLVYPALARNERSVTALRAYVARRARALGVPAPPDPTALRPVPPSAPLLTKAELRRQPAPHLRPRRPGSLLRTTIRSSGTSGSPLTLVQSLGALVREQAFVYRQLRWIGWRPGGRRAWIRGDIVCDAQPADGRYWCRDRVGNVLMLSSYHLSGSTMGGYVAALEAFDPVVIQAYPSSVAALANWLAAAGRPYRGQALRGVMTSSETLEPSVRRAVVQAFGVPVFDWYGQAERVAAIGTCEQGRYHVLTDYGGVELRPGNQDVCEIIGTSLNNNAMPLTRYCTGDNVVAGKPQRCPCGRIYPVIDAVIGRQETILTLPDGRIVARLDRVFQGFDGRLFEGQIRYHREGRFTLRVVVDAGFSARDETALMYAFLVRVPGVDVAVERVAAIERGQNGKFEFIAYDHESCV
jgi:phenylacetate-CoA ligase